MQFRQLATGFGISPQVSPSDIAAIRSAGFRAVICNRPDGESADQPAFSEVLKAACELGIEARYLPVQVGYIGDAETAQFGELLRTLPGPVLAYCRTGNRSGMLWTLLASKRPS